MPPTKLSIRAADLAADRDGILAVLQENLPAAGAPARFDWLYRGNPEGPARLWVAVDGERVVGTSAALPRRFRVGDRTVAGLTLSDFAFDAGYRSLGPAIQLLRATLAPVTEGEVALSVDFPSETMRAIYRRIGGIDLGPVHRWVRPLRLDDALRRKYGTGGLARVAGAAANAALAVRDAAARPAAGLRLEEWTGAFDARFDALDERIHAARAGRWTVRGVRDAAFLDWKYRRHAMWPHRTLVAKSDGALAGYAIFRDAGGGTVHVADLAAVDERARRTVVAGLVRLGRKQRAERIVIEALDESGIAPMLGGIGFVRREAGVGPVPTLALDCPARDRLVDPGEWWLNGGDRDI